MKSIIFVLTLILCGCGNPYPNDENKINKMIEMAFEDGYKFGYRAGMVSCGVDSITTDGTLVQPPKRIVQSITFKYDSIMIINFDSSEVK